MVRPYMVLDKDKLQFFIPNEGFARTSQTTSLDGDLTPTKEMDLCDVSALELRLILIPTFAKLPPTSLRT